MNNPEQVLLDSSQVSRAIEQLATDIAARVNRDVTVGIIGIRTRGVPLADRLAKNLREKHNIHPKTGAVDITLYRDDLTQIAHNPVLQGTDVLFNIDGAELILVDDVLYTGRTVRAALNVICDLGRPARISLAVLVDRGGRELPLQPDHVAHTMEAPPGKRIDVRLVESDNCDEVVLS